MAITDIPSIKDLKTRIVSDVESQINQDIPTTLLSFVRVFASAFAVLFYLLYQTTAWVYKQIFTQSQSIDSLRLEGESLGVIYQLSTSAIVSATVTGSGGTVSSGTTFVGPNQITYRVESTTAIPGPVDMTALTSGTIGNLSVGDELSLASSSPGVDSLAVVLGMTSTADDDEEIEDYRNRVAIRKRTKFIYGSPAGYTLSGLETPGFIWIGPFADPGLPGNVNIYGRVEFDLLTDGVPTSPQLDELENFLRFDNGTGQEIRRPISDILIVLPVSNTEFDVTITVQNVNTALKNEIEEAVGDKIKSYEPFIDGVTQSRNDTLTVTDIAIVGDTIANPQGGKVVSVALFDVSGDVFFNAYTFFGGVFGKLRNTTFIDIV